MATSADGTARTPPCPRRVGASAERRVAPDAGPPAEDGTPHMRPLMRPQDEPSGTAGWAAPPRSDITGRPFAHEHVPLS